MEQFLPTPYHSAEWWSTQELVNTIGDWDFELTGDSWIACCSFASEMDGPYAGYPLILSTSTDCLLWLRWIVLPILSHNDYFDKYGKDVELSDLTKEVGDFIDGAPESSKSEDILWDIKEEFFDLYDGEAVYVRYKSIHEFLSERGSLEDWRRAIGDNRIEIIADRWVMPPENWDEVANYIIQDLIDCDSTLEGKFDDLDDE